MRVRQSLLKKWSMCPLQAYFSEIQGLPSQTGSKAAFGTCIHAALEHYNRTGDMEESIRLFLEVWDNPAELNIDIGVWNKYTTFGGLRQKGIEILRAYHDRMRWEQRTLVAMEHTFLVPFGEHELTGTVDLVSLRKNHRGKHLLVIEDYKPLHVDTLVLTPRGWCKLRDIHVGNEVIGVDGKATRVVGEKDQGVLPGVKLEFTDGSAVVCSRDHRWTVVDVLRRVPVEQTITVAEMLPLRCSSGNRQFRYFLPTAAPVEFVSVPQMLIPPYTMGVILADGSLQNSIAVSRPDAWVRERVENELPDGLHIEIQNEITWRISRDAKSGKNIYTDELRRLGIWGCRSLEKFIPECYLRASVADRKELLAGLMDCDGGSSTRTDYRTSSPRLRDDVIELCRSLGGVPTTATVPGYYIQDGVRHEAKDCHIIVPRMPFNPFSLARKARTWKPPQMRQNRAIKNIEDIGDVEMKCIKVAAADGLFVLDDYVVTHNTNTRAPTHVELALNIQWTTYIYATLQREFWFGHPGTEFQAVPNAEWYWEMMQDVPRRGIWVHLWNDCKELDAGGRDLDDFGRLYRLCNEIQRAIEHEVFVPMIGQACIYCAYSSGPCPVVVPTRTYWETERPEADENAWL